MSRFRVPGGHRRKVHSGDRGDTRDYARATARRTEERIDPCRFPRDCLCVNCTPDTEDGGLCMDCGGEGGGGAMDPDIWFECATCKGTGRTA